MSENDIPYPYIELMDKEKIKENYVPVRVCIGKIIEKPVLEYSTIPSERLVSEEKDWLTKSIFKGLKSLIEFKEEDGTEGKKIVAELKIYARKDLLKEAKEKETGNE